MASEKAIKQAFSAFAETLPSNSLWDESEKALFFSFFRMGWLVCSNKKAFRKAMEKKRQE